MGKKKQPAKVNGISNPEAAAALPAETPVTDAVKSKKSKAQAQKPKKPTHPKAKITFRHNILPPLIGIVAFLEVLAILNAQWVSAQYQYYFSEPATVSNISTKPDNPNPNAPARIMIPEIGIDAPVVTDEKSYDAGRVQTALQKGTLMYGASAEPGQIGNVVIVGHSSGQLWAPGDYKFVFTLLDKLDKDDRIIVDFKGKRYIYRVDSEEVVRPTDINVLQHSTDSRLTLITCTPVGTSKDRLVITARQVSPNASTNTQIPAGTQLPVTSPVIPN